MNCVVDLDMSDCVGCWPAHQGEVYTVGMTPDGSACYSMGSDGKVSQIKENVKTSCSVGFSSVIKAFLVFVTNMSEIVSLCTFAFHLHFMKKH